MDLSLFIAPSACDTSSCTSSKLSWYTNAPADAGVSSDDVSARTSIAATLTDALSAGVGYNAPLLPGVASHLERLGLCETVSVVSIGCLGRLLEIPGCSDTARTGQPSIGST